VNHAQYLHLVSRIGIKRAEIDLWLMENEGKLPEKREQVMREIGELFEEADHALFHLMRRFEVVKNEMYVKELELKEKRKGMDRLMQTML